MGKWNSSTLALQNALTWALWPPRWLEKMWGRCGEDMGCVINMREWRWLKSKGSSMAIWRHHDFWLVFIITITWYIFMRQICWWHVADPDMPLINQKHELYSYGSIAGGLHSALRGTRGLEEESKAQDGISQQFSQEQFWFERSFFQADKTLAPLGSFQKLKEWSHTQRKWMCGRLVLGPQKHQGPVYFVTGLHMWNLWGESWVETILTSWWNIILIPFFCKLPWTSG